MVHANSSRNLLGYPFSAYCKHSNINHITIIFSPDILYSNSVSPSEERGGSRGGRDRREDRSDRREDRGDRRDNRAQAAPKAPNLESFSETEFPSLS